MVANTAEVSTRKSSLALFHAPVLRMAVGRRGPRGPSAASRVATEEQCTEEGRAQYQHRPTEAPLAMETPGRRTGAANHHVRLTVRGVPGLNGVKHRLPVVSVEHLRGSGVATIRNERSAESHAMETTLKSSTLISHPVRSTAVGVNGPIIPSAASLAAKVVIRRDRDPATDRLQTMEENCAKEMHFRPKSARDDHARFPAAGATGSSGPCVVRRVDLVDRRSAEGSATIPLRCTMENNAKETRSTQSAASSSTALSTVHGVHGRNGRSTPLLSESERIRWTIPFQKTVWTFSGLEREIRLAIEEPSLIRLALTPELASRPLCRITEVWDLDRTSLG
jgi:hypothetical protein